MITVKHNGNTNTYYGLSTDTKPVGDSTTGKILNASVFFEMDTGKAYMYNGATNTWIEL